MKGIQPESTLDVEDAMAEEEADEGPWGLQDYGIPRPSRSIKPDTTVEAKLRHFHTLRQQNIHFNATLQANKSFRNPAILSKLVDFVAVDDKLAGFPKDVWSSSAGLGPDAWASSIAEKQKRQNEERERAQERGKRSNINFTSSSSTTTRATSSKDHSRSDKKYSTKHRDEQKRSRWDRDDSIYKSSADGGSSELWRRERDRDRERSRSPHRRR